jgi:hypothetical protein
MKLMETPRQGLFAFVDGEFVHHLQDEPELDHVMWFERLGLPSSGPRYDAILRGKVTYDVDADRIVLGYYGTARLSNARYRQIVDAFGLDEGRVVEKMLLEPF